MAEGYVRDGMEELRDWYSNLFLHGEHGREVLTSILQNLGYFDMRAEGMNPDMLAFANRLLYMCRAFGSDGESQLDFVRRM